MSLRLALIRSLEGIETSNDDAKNEEKKHQRKVKKKTPVVELPKIDKCVRNADPSKVSVYIMCIILIAMQIWLYEFVHMIICSKRNVLYKVI